MVTKLCECAVQIYRTKTNAKFVPQKTVVFQLSCAHFRRDLCGEWLGAIVLAYQPKSSEPEHDGDRNAKLYHYNQLLHLFVLVDSIVH